MAKLCTGDHVFIGLSFILKIYLFSFPLFLLETLVNIYPYLNINSSTKLPPPPPDLLRDRRRDLLLDLKRQCGGQVGSSHITTA